HALCQTHCSVKEAKLLLRRLSRAKPIAARRGEAAPISEAPHSGPYGPRGGRDSVRRPARLLGHAHAKVESARVNCKSSPEHLETRMVACGSLPSSAA